MSEPQNDHDLGELAVRQNFLSADELKICLEAQRTVQPPRPLREIMLEMQLVTKTQLDRLVKLCQKPHDHKTAFADLFGRLAVELEYATSTQVEECLAEQRLLESQGQKMRLGQIMLKRRYLTTDQFLEILKLQEKTVLTCPSCSAKYFVGDLGEPESGGVFKCLACQAALNLPVLTPVQAAEAITPPPVPAVKPPSASPETIRVTPPPQRRPAPDETPQTLRVTPPPVQTRPPTDHGSGRPFGRYQILETLGKGPVGVVYLARDGQRQRRVALKKLQEVEGDPQSIQKLLREARVAAQLDHPGLLEIYEVGSNEETPYFAMEFVEGQSLEKMIEAGRVPCDDLVALLEKVLRALDYAHSQGIAHRNLKPSNILVDGRREPHVADFGLRSGVGPFMSPEQLRGDTENVDARSDVYAMGVLLYQVLTGRRPYDSPDGAELSKLILRGEPERPRAIRTDVPRDLEVICLKAMDRDRALRYGTAGEMADDLRRYLEGELISAKPISVITRAGVRLKRNKLRAAGIILGVLALGAGGYYGVRAYLGYRNGKKDKDRIEARTKAKPHYESAEKISTEVWKGLSTDRDYLRDLRKRLRGLSVRLDDAQRAAVPVGGDPARLMGEARDGIQLASQKMAGSSGEAEEVRRLVAGAKQKCSDAVKKWKDSPAEVATLTSGSESDPFKDVVALCDQRIKAWPGESGRRLDEAVSKLDQALAEDAEFPEARHLRAKIHLWRGRLDAAGEDFRKAGELYAKLQQNGEMDKLLEKESVEDRAKKRGDFDRKALEHRLDFGKYGFLIFDLFRGRRVVLFGERGESLSFAARETPLAERARKEAEGELRAFLAAGKGTSSETALVQLLLRALGEGTRSGDLEPRFRMDPSDETAARAAALVSLSEGNYKKAYQNFGYAVQYSSPLLESGDVYGVCAHARPLLEWSLAAHTAEIDKKSTPELLVNRGVLRLALRRFEEARQDFEAALRAKPGDPEATLRKIVLQFQSGQKRDSVPSVAAGDPSAPMAFALRTAAYLEQGDFVAALAEVAKGLAKEVALDDPTLLFLRGRCHLAMQNAEAAGTDADRVSTMVPGAAAALELRAAARADVRNWTEARKDADAAIEDRPGFARAHVTRARARAGAPPGDLKGAERDLDRALQLDSKCTAAWVMRGQLRHARIVKDTPKESVAPLLTEALNAFEEAIKIDRDCTEAVVWRALCRLELGKVRDFSELRALVKQYPKCALAHEWLAQLLRQSKGNREDVRKNKEEAKQLLVKLKGLQPHRKVQIDKWIAEIDNDLSRPFWLQRFQHVQEDHIRKASEASKNDDSKAVKREYAQARLEYEHMLGELPAELPTDDVERYWMTLGSYNYACVLAYLAQDDAENRDKMVEAAFQWLSLACRLGYRRWKDDCPGHGTGAAHMRADDDLKLLRTDPRFGKLLDYSEE